MGQVKYTINTMLVKDMSIAKVREIALKVQLANGSKNAGVDQDLGIAALYMWNDIGKYRYSDEAVKMTVERFLNLRRMASDDFIQIHRLNHVAYKYLEEFVPDLIEKKTLRMNSKVCWKKIERTFNDYLSGHYELTEKSAWRATQDYTRLVYDLIHPFLEPLENSVRDYLILHRSEIIESGQKDDIALLTKTYVALMFLAALRNTRRNFFANQYEGYDFEISVDFKFADIDVICDYFVEMMKFMGIRFTTDKDGDSVPLGIDMSNSTRANSAWKRICQILTDEELMDQKALEAINLTPEVKEKYDAIISKSEKEEFDDAIERLKEAYKVTT